MTLSFSQKWGKNMGDLAGQQNYFIEKIWSGLLTNIGFVSAIEAAAYMEEIYSRFGLNLDYTKIGILPKLHTIRHDPHDRWKAGNKIHFVINNRTKNRFQFAPVIEVKSVQEIEIRYMNIEELTKGFGIDLSITTCVKVFIDRHIQSVQEISQLANNDGFNSVSDFFKFFNSDFKGKIIHWTDLRY